MNEVPGTEPGGGLSARAIGARLVARGALRQAELERALAVEAKQGRSFAEVVRRLGLVSDEAWASALADELGLEFVEEDGLEVHSEVARQVSERFLRERCMVPVESDGKALAIAMADPLDDGAVRAMELFSGQPIERRVAAERAIRRALDALYGAEGPNVRDIIDEQAWTSAAAEEDIERLKEIASEAPVVRLVDTVLREALARDASDIHIEPSEHRLVFRYRIDGVLREVEAPARHVAPALLSRIKIMAGLDIAERRLAQDGRIRLKVQGRNVDLRVSTLPSLYGESVVIRLLEHDDVPPELGALGMQARDRASVETMLAGHNGIVLATGPTGCGKTTTLYAGLRLLTTPERKVVTVENPVEYENARTTQIQVNAEIGLSFAHLLRAILRHDPDVIMIGEMRDLETAEIAVQAALTGHIVLSSLHTNDAPSAVTRLLEMGIEDYLVASTLKGVIAQRLVRRLCRECREPYAPSAQLVRRLGLEAIAKRGRDQAFTLYRASGCARCAGTGYRGRVGVFEQLRPDEAFRVSVLERRDAQALRQAALRAGMTPMLQDALGKALEGVTSLEEIGRVVEGG